MRKYVIYLVVFLIGAAAGMWLCRSYHFRDVTGMVQNDTIVRFDTIRYSKLELIGKNYNLDIPKIGSPELVYIPTHSLDTIYRDNIKYVTLPRQYFHTTTPDAEIWHSGVDSRIDSLVVFRKTEKITQSVVPKTRRHGIGLGIEANYAGSFRLPVQLEYSYSVKPWLSVYGYLEYELLTRRAGAGIGTKLIVSW